MTNAVTEFKADRNVITSEAMTAFGHIDPTICNGDTYLNQCPLNGVAFILKV